MGRRKAYSSYAWCRLIAWLINCDNAQWNFTDRTFTAESVWHCNSHGELYGVFSAIDYVQKNYNGGVFDKDFKKRLTGILNGNEEPVAKEDSVLLGMYCMTVLFRMPPEFEEFLQKLTARLVAHTSN